jgi:hypothetical protein
MFSNTNRTVFLDRDRTVDNVQKHNIYTNVPSPQTFKSKIKWRLMRSPCRLRVGVSPQLLKAGIVKAERMTVTVPYKYVHALWHDAWKPSAMREMLRKQSLLGNGSVNTYHGKEYTIKIRRIVGHVDFYAARFVLKKSGRLFLSRTSCCVTWWL